jgi:hypothetical protein
MWRRGALAAAVVSVALGAPAAGAAQTTTPAAARVQSVDAVQRTLLDRGVRVTLAVRRTTRLRVVVTARRRGARTVPVVTRGFERTLRAGRRTVTLRLSAAGRRTIGTCDARTLTVTVLRVRGRAGRATRLSRSSRALRLDRTRCRRGDAVPAKPGREAGEQPIDLATSDADRCDFIDPSACLHPFPNDRFTVPDASTATGRRLALTLASMPRNIAGKPMEPVDQNRGDGFSPGSLIVTKVAGIESDRAAAANRLVPIDDLERAFDPDQRVVVVNARTKERHLIWAEVDANPADPADRTLLLRPGTHFTEGDRYVVALRDLRDEDGKVIAPSPGFRVLRDGRRTTNPAVESRRAHFESLFVTLAEAGVDRDTLYRAWDFTVASERSLSERLLSIRDDAFRQLGDTNLADLKVEGRSPAFTVEKVTEDPDGPDNPIARKIEGTVDVPCYLNVPGCGSGAKFAYPQGSRTGPPQAIPGNTTQARFTCHVPRTGLTGGPLRPSLYGHGLLGSRGEIGQGQLRSFGQDHGMLFCSSDWIGMSCADVDVPPDQNTVATILADTVAGRAPVLPNCDLPNIATLLLDLSNFASLTDRVQQGIVNFLYLGRALIHPEGLGTHEAFRAQGRSMVDTTRLYYDGNSQGGIIGGALVSVAPDLDRAALGVPGMNYSTLLRRSVDFDQYAQILYAAYPDELQRPLVLALMQLLWDRAETAGYAAHLTKDAYPNTPPHEVLLHVGLGDHQVAQVTAEVMARTAGMSARTPWADPGRDRDEGDGHFGIPAIRSYPFSGSAIVLWDIGPLRTVDGKQLGTPPPPDANVPPREGVDPHEAPRREPAARAMKSAFFAPGGRVTDTCASGRPCYAFGWTGP